MSPVIGMGETGQLVPMATKASAINSSSAMAPPAIHWLFAGASVLVIKPRVNMIANRMRTAIAPM